MTPILIVPQIGVIEEQVHSLCVDSRPGDRLWLIFR